MLSKLWKKRVYRAEALNLLWRDWADLRGPVLDSRVHLEEAAQWLLRAQAATPDNGVSGGYSFEDGWIASYPETTGYIIPTLLEYNKFSRKQEYYDHALMMAHWELTVQDSCGGFQGHFVNGNHPPVIFNTGQVIFGLLAAFEATKDEKFFEGAKTAGVWLASVQNEDGAWHQFYYRGAIHSYNTRTAWALLELGFRATDERFLVVAQRHLDWALTQQEKNGWFRNAAFSPDEDPFLHTIAYTTQGLLEAGLILQREDYVTAAERTCRKVMSFVDSEGKVPATFNRSWESTSFYSCLTGNAQMAIQWLRLYAVTQDIGYKQSAQLVNRFLKSIQDCRTSKPHLRGAIKGSHPIYGRYLFGTYPNWATKFYMDSLLLEEAVENRTNLCFHCW
jgi:uncharacterized protein YyaL (SSP411 family)